MSFRDTTSQPVAILLVTGDDEAAATVARALASPGTPAVSLERVGRLVPALDRLARGGVAACVVDLDLPDSTGVPTLLAVRVQAPRVPLVVLVGGPPDAPEARLAAEEGSAVLRKSGLEEGSVRAGIERSLRTGPLARARAEASRRDPLTGLVDSGGLAAAAAGQMQIAIVTGRPFALLYVDVDGLDRVNAQLGREAGDRLLAETAALLSSVFRASDVVARVAGDEFCVLLADGTPDGSGVELAWSRLGERLAELNARGRPGGPLSLTVGLARYEPHLAAGFEELLARAERDVLSRKLRALAASG